MPTLSAELLGFCVAFAVGLLIGIERERNKGDGPARAAAGVRTPQSIDAMAVIYMATTMVWLLIALRFVDPTQMVGRVKAQRA